MDRTAELARLHFELIQGLILNGSCFTNDELAGKMEIPVEKAEELLVLLSEMHGIVLHPYARKPCLGAGSDMENDRRNPSSPFA